MVIISIIALIIFGSAIFYLGVYLKDQVDKPLEIENGKTPTFSERSKGKVDSWNRQYIRLRIYDDFVILKMNDAFQAYGYTISLSSINHVELIGGLKKGIRIHHKDWSLPEEIIIWSTNSIDHWKKVGVKII